MVLYAVLLSKVVFTIREREPWPKYIAPPSHAVLLTDYTEGVFYCADSDPGQKSGRILLTETLIAETCGSQDQDVVINSLKKYWYIK